MENFGRRKSTNPFGVLVFALDRGAVQVLRVETDNGERQGKKNYMENERDEVRQAMATNNVHGC